MFTVIATIFVLGVLIFFHELGHFIVAKKAGVKVEIFSIGFGPKIFGTVRGETEYKLAAFPIGGYVKMAGEELEDEMQKNDQPEDQTDESRKFYAKSIAKRVAIVLSGSLANYLLGIILFAMIFMAGVPTLTTKIGSVQEDSPAARAGIKPDDRITAIDDHTLWKWEEMAEIIQDNHGKILLFAIERNGGKILLKVTPDSQERTTVFMKKITVGIIGIGSAFDYRKEKFGVLRSVKKAFEQAIFIATSIVKGIYLMLTGKIKADIAGPIGIIQITGEQVKLGFLNLLFFTAFLSINLGTINLFPIPALDGGHLLFLMIEKIKGSPVKIKHRIVAHQIGWMLLILIFFFVTYKDILRIGEKFW